MAARDEAGRKADARTFVDRVDVLVSAALRREAPPPAADDAIRLAAAFVLLDRLVSQYVMLSGPAIAAEEGAVEAQRVLFSLRTGYNHPVWTYLNGIRTKYRASAKAPLEELQRRAYTVACIRALQKINGGISIRAAAKALSARDYYRSHGVTFATLRKWPERLQEPPALDLADRWQRELVANARDADDAMRRTITALQTIEAADRTPSLAAAARQRPAYAKVVDASGRIVAEVEVDPRNPGKVE